jgi:hypothetical protein
MYGMDLQEEEERLEARLRMMSDYQSYDFSFKVLVLSTKWIFQPDYVL